MKLLVADDSTTIQRVIQIAFENQNAQLVTVSSYIELLSELGKTKFDVIICDANLSGTGSIADFEKIKEIQSGTPVLLLQGSYDNVDQTGFEAAGFTNFLKKPFDADKIVDDVKALMGDKGGSATPSFSLNDDATSQELKSYDEQFSAPAKPQVANDKGQKAFSAPAANLSLSSVEELTDAGREETSPALNLDLMDVAEDTMGATVMEGMDPPSFNTPPAQAKESPLEQAPVAEIDLDALAAHVLPALKEQLHSEIKLQLKQSIGSNLPQLMREIIKEELSKLMDQKNSLFIDK